ncbi:tripartite tricarboxylate transporter substrate binding protein [Variovorax sp. J22P240]|uniref:Bug family tripartite tricarboxylate transporter substrate binding protein n=1 Tax=Variovorax sp. J22P240 TaxID=3053514 RepID=UPI002577EF05|nr:tripartite tricarboxylate transporter substrate binding protein [Variovorax sp. J22P240]MDM0000753.1 tripartite tricarboxylate transporter substrate binding protein [Variovorax sp. J22P240]
MKPAFPSRRRAMGALAALALLPRAGSANTLHQRPLRVVLPYPPGSPGDVVLRAVAMRWQAQTGQPLLVEHRSGASGTLGAEAVLQSAPDGHTLLFATSDILVNNTALFRNLRYDARRDFKPLAQVGPVPLVLAVPVHLPADDLVAFTAWASARTIAYGSWGEGSHAHIVGEALMRRLGLRAVHVPYRGLAPMLQDLMGAQINAGFGVPPSVAPLVAGGRLRALAVTGEARSVAMPGVPTLLESGYPEPAFRLRQWAAFMARSSVPQGLLTQLEFELAAAVAHENTRTVLLSAGFESARAAGPAQAQALIDSDLAVVPALIRELGVLPQ